MLPGDESPVHLGRVWVGWAAVSVSSCPRMVAGSVPTWQRQVVERCLASASGLVGRATRRLHTVGSREGDHRAVEGRSSRD